jgi:hypothetical protein
MKKKIFYYALALSIGAPLGGALVASRAQAQTMDCADAGCWGGKAMCLVIVYSDGSDQICGRPKEQE